MAGALIQPAILSAVVSKSNRRLHGTEKIRKTATMICNVGSHPSKTQAFTSRLQSFTARCSHDLHSMFEEERDRQGLVAAVFEHFTDEAIEVIRLADEEARRLEHNFIGTGHILLGLMSEGTGIAAQVLGINLKLNDARVEVERMTGRGSEFVDEEMHFTPCAKRVFELSIEEADKLCPLFELVHTIKGKYIRSEHLLLGLLSEGDGVASRLLENLGADPSNIRGEVFALILEEADSSHVDRFLPDKAIDLIDEAGSRVRLRHAQLAEEARELDKEVWQITKEKK